MRADEHLAHGAGSSSGEFWSSRAWWRRAGQTAVAMWGGTALAFVGTVVAARGLGPDDYGAVVLAIATATFLGTFLDLTLEEGVVHHGFRVLEAGDVGGLRALLKTSLRLDLAVGLFVAALLIGFASPIADIASDGRLDPNLVRFAALVILAATVNGTTGAVLLLVGRADLRAWTSVAATLARVVGVLVAVQIGGAKAVLAAYVAGSLAGAGLQGFLAWRSGWREWAKTNPRGPTQRWLRPLAHFGIHTSITTTLLTSERSLVLVLLGALAGPAAAGIYSIALLPLTIVSTADGPIRLVFFAETAKLAAANRVATLRRTVRGYTVVALLVGVPAAIAGWFLLPWLIGTLFSDRFDGAVEPARILLIAAVAQLAAGGWAKGLPAAIGRPQLRTIMSAVFMVTVVVLTVLLVPSNGVKGAAIANSAAAVSTYVAWWFLTKRALRGEDPAGPGFETTSETSVPRAPVGIEG